MGHLIVIIKGQYIPIWTWPSLMMQQMLQSGWVMKIICIEQIASQIILTCRMPSDTPNGIIGRADLLSSGEKPKKMLEI